MPRADAEARRALRRLFGIFATGVTVVTVGGTRPHGMTANSFASVSLDPPLVLVCVDRGAVMHSCLDTATAFGISVLTAGQARLARYFADPHRPVGADEFAQVAMVAGERTGVPLIADALAWFECELWRRYDGGDHTIVVGRLLAAEQPRDAEALLFHEGQLRTTSSDRKATS
ncbi:flavin reductase family protein [Micromonospora sp. KLBMP9576]|uniref:flavin reductase family protein n=1 Tax=Micromonospora sp. KLBMP9576 TaxID=3424769 RepID=UPI003D93A113